MPRIYSAGGIVSKKKYNGLFLLCITTKDNKLALPKGHLQPGETAEQAAIRELTEEVGLKNSRVLSFVGNVDRQGTEPDGRSSLKRISYYCMDGSGYSYQHEENYVWVDFSTAVRTMRHHEERNFLLVHHDVIQEHASTTLSGQEPLMSYDECDLASMERAGETSIVQNVVQGSAPGTTVVFVGNPPQASLPKLLKERSVVVIPPAHWENNPGVIDRKNRSVVTPRTVENIIDDDLPHNIALFYAQKTLNLSDTKTFFLLNQVRKKMAIGGIFFLEGRSDEDVQRLHGQSLSSNLFLAGRKVLRVWNPEYVHRELVDRLGLTLVLEQERSEENNGTASVIRQFVLKKDREEGF